MISVSAMPQINKRKPTVKFGSLVIFYAHDCSDSAKDIPLISVFFVVTVVWINTDLLEIAYNKLGKCALM